MIDYEQVEDEWRTTLPGEGDNKLPIPDEEYISNMRVNLKRDLPNVMSEPEHDRTMVFVGGGPTAKLHLDEIRSKSLDPKYDVFCSNRTHDWLLENGIRPYAQFIIDPKVAKIKDVQNPQDDIKYMIGIQCHPPVFDKLAGYDLRRLISCCGTQSKSGMYDYDIAKGILEEGTYAFHLGGTMAGLRAMTLADILGYVTVDLYGFDSCFFDWDADGMPHYYSYDKPRAEDTLEIETSDGKTWNTTPVFASQARQYLKWKQRMGWIKFNIHGDSFTAAMDLADEKTNAVKHDRRFSALHLMQNQMLHKDEGTSFGDVGRHWAGPVALLSGQLIKKFGPLTLLDYGCGQTTLAKRLPPIEGLTVNNYDFAIEEHSQEPEPADIVVCTDVLEHIEPDCLDNVLDHLQELTKKVCYCVIAIQPAAKAFSDGKNVHLSVHSQEWWYPQLRKRFDVLERGKEPGRIIFVLQSRELGRSVITDKTVVRLGGTGFNAVEKSSELVTR